MDVFRGREDQAGDDDHGLTHFYMAREKYVDGLDFAGLEFLLHCDKGNKQYPVYAITIYCDGLATLAGYHVRCSCLLC